MPSCVNRLQWFIHLYGLGVLCRRLPIGDNCIHYFVTLDSITEHRVPELISVLGSQPAGDMSHKPGGRLPLYFPAVILAKVKKGKGSPYSNPERRVPELIRVLCSQPAGDVSHKPGGRLPLLSARPAVSPATLKRAATNFAAW